MNKQHQIKSELAIQLGELLNPLEGKVLLIEEFITRDKSRGYDRHCSISNKVSFAVEKVMWQMSGGNFYLYGPEPTQYAFLTGELASISVDNNIYEIIEQYENKTERKTILTVEEKVCITSA